MALKVTPRDIGTYRVMGDSSVEHLVDLMSHDFNGECTCEHFTHRLGPILKGDRDPMHAPAGGLRCKHINAARDYLTDEILKKI